MTVPTPTIITTEHARDHSDRNGHAIQVIVLHHTGGKNSLDWLKGNPQGTSIHVLARRDGTCYQMVPDDRAAHHVGFSRLMLNGVLYDEHHRGQTCNEPSLGIELENLGDGKEDYPEVQLKAAAWWIDHWWSLHGKIPVIRHAECDQHGKVDPLGLKVQDVLKYLGESGAPPAPPSSQIAPDTAVLGAPRATMDQATRYLVKRGTDRSYTPEDVRLIANFYWLSSQMIGLDPLLLFSQMVHETGGLTSWWCLRPRRNPAGIGVTGETNRQRGQPGIDWAYDAHMGLWKRGHVFASWDLGIKAHAAHLMTYAVTLDEMSEIQNRMLGFDPRFLAIPEHVRGTVKTLGDLDGKWAVPGNGYGKKIATIANTIRSS